MEQMEQMEQNLSLLISRQDIEAAVKRLAQELDRDYGDRSPIIIGILKGAAIFLADLIRYMNTPIRRVELIRLSSYGSSTVSSGDVKMVLDIAPGAITGEDVILVEDIVDTGLSITKAMAALQTYHPASIKLCSLLDKPDRRKVPVTIDYLGITVPDRFIVGYGIDFDEQYRQLPDICTINTQNFA
jgi:hypoxanthine phosphoribosyltransferase